MKIKDLKIYVLKSALAEPFAFSQGWVHQRSTTLVEIITDEGITGWGESFAQGLEPPEISAAVIDHALRPIVIGANPLDVEVPTHVSLFFFLMLEARFCRCSCGQCVSAWCRRAWMVLMAAEIRPTSCPEMLKISVMVPAWR